MGGPPQKPPDAASFAVLCELCARNPLERYVERKARKVPQSSQFLYCVRRVLASLTAQFAANQTRVLNLTVARLNIITTHVDLSLSGRGQPRRHPGSHDGGPGCPSLFLDIRKRF